MSNRGPDQRHKPHKTPAESTLYNRFIPILFVVLAVITVALIVFAFGVMTGVIPWA
ncbi:MAG: hypothetical protein HPY64_09325 [Anaerolineae bacterium]|nr:hypothetical protein [Anaerolineae bacterium]